MVFFLHLPIAHVVKVLCELRQVRTLLLILLLGPEQHLRNLENNRKQERDAACIKQFQETFGGTF